MNTNQHSPAPWAVASNGASLKIVDADGKAVAMIKPRSGAWNGDLLAAAPELLSVLEAILPHAARRIQGTTDGDSILNAAREAIAKAKGEIK